MFPPKGAKNPSSPSSLFRLPAVHARMQLIQINVDVPELISPSQLRFFLRHCMNTAAASLQYVVFVASCLFFCHDGFPRGIKSKKAKTQRCDLLEKKLRMSVSVYRLRDEICFRIAAVDTNT